MYLKFITFLLAIILSILITENIAASINQPLEHEVNSLGEVKREIIWIISVLK